MPLIFFDAFLVAVGVPAFGLSPLFYSGAAVIYREGEKHTAKSRLHRISHRGLQCSCALCSCGMEQHPFMDVFQSDPGILVTISQPLLHPADFTQASTHWILRSRGVDNRRWEHIGDRFAWRQLAGECPYSCTANALSVESPERPYEQRLHLLKTAIHTTVTGYRQWRCLSVLVPGRKCALGAATEHQCQRDKLPLRWVGQT
jgi:transposase